MQNKKRVILIGLGTIARYHAQALLSSDAFSLCGVCDLRREQQLDPLYVGLPFATDYTELIEQLHPDAAVIATPPATHRLIAQECIRRGVEVFIEKPLATTTSDFSYLFSEQAWGRYHAICHNIYGEEVLWFEDHIRLARISRVSLSLVDPYLDASGAILADRLPLAGCWADSGTNALALLSRFVRLEQLNNVVVAHQRDKKSGLPIESRLTAATETTSVEIDIRWSKTQNAKQCVVKADGHQYRLDNSEQTVWCDGKQLFAYVGEPRLMRHYKNYYRLFEQHQPDKQTLEALYSIIIQNL